MIHQALFTMKTRKLRKERGKTIRLPSWRSVLVLLASALLILPGLPPSQVRQQALAAPPAPQYWDLTAPVPGHMTLWGAEANDYTGYSVASGDVNGDGRDDAIIGAFRAHGPDYRRKFSGRVYVVFGPANVYGLVDLASEADVVIYGADAYDYVGSAVASGDVNGDGYDDIIMAAEWADGPYNRRVECGEVYTVFGSPSIGGTIDLSTQADVVMYGPDIRDQIGTSLTTGRVNGDEFDDIIIGAEWADGLGPGHRREDAGEVYVVLGRSSFPNSMELYGQADLIIYGEEKGDHAGDAVASGDLNGDGYDDIVVGALWADGPDNKRPQAGGAYVVLSSQNFGSRMRDLRTDADMTIYGAEKQDRAGAALSIGDVNGDGYDDLLIGASYANGPYNGRTWGGEVYAILGSDAIGIAPDLKSVDLQRQADIHIYGADRGDRAGTAVTTADVNGDGFDDIVIGASFAGGPDNSQDKAGEVSVVLGSATIANTIDLAKENALTICGTEANDQAGVAVASGDTNADGYDDIILGANWANPGHRRKAGVAYVVAPQIDLSVSYVTAPPAYVSPGAVITYTLGYANNGAATAFDVQITDLEAPGLRKTRSIFNDQVTPLESGTQSWSIPELRPGDSGTITIVAEVSPEASRGTVIPVTVQISGVGMEISPSNNTSTADITVSPPPHKIVVTANPAQIVADGVSTSTITAEITNEDGNPVADGTQVTFTTTSGHFPADPYVTTTTNGIATALLTSSDQVGKATVTVSAGPCSESVEVQFTGRIENVTTGESYDSINAAINAANYGDTIVVNPGTYNETITMKSGVKIYGAGAEVTVIKGDGSGPVVMASGAEITSDAVIAGFTITGGNADYGGGVYIKNASPTVENNIITSNLASYFGGGIYVDSGSPTIRNNVIAGNSAGVFGGGMYVAGGSPAIINNTIVGNLATIFGGGLFNLRGTLAISNNIIAINTAFSSGGIHNHSGVLTSDYNNIWGNIPDDYYNFTPGAHDMREDPRLDNPSVGNYHLRTDSPCIDAGDPATPRSTDLDGDLRPADGNEDNHAVVDIGADEHTKSRQVSTSEKPVEPTPTPDRS